MNLHKFPWLLLLAALYLVFLATFILVSFQGDWTAMFAMGTMLVIVGGLIGSMLVYSILHSILERLKMMHEHSIERNRRVF